MVIGKVTAATLTGDELVKKGDGRETTVHCPNLSSGWGEDQSSNSPVGENVLQELLQ